MLARAAAAHGRKSTSAVVPTSNACSLHFHDLRHEAGSCLIEAGWPVHHVQEMLGHADLKQTSTCLNVTLSGLKESMRKLDEAEQPEVRRRRERLQARCKRPPATDRPLPRNEDARRDANSLIH